MMTQTEFVRIAQALQAEARALGLEAPAFRTPVRRPGHSRTLRRCPNAVVVTVTLGREVHDVTSDMIDGVVAANQLTDPAHVEQVRSALWLAAGLAVAA